jgi:hypothetical protein
MNYANRICKDTYDFTKTSFNIEIYPKLISFAVDNQ